MARRTPSQRLTRTDWTGDAVLTLIGGTGCLLAVFLPWANTPGSGPVNYGLTHPDTVRGVLHTEWGVPALGLALIVLAMGTLMLTLGPGRVGIVAGLVTAATGVAIVLVARDATSAAYGWSMQAGLGSVVTLFAGVLLVPIGLSSAAVAGALLYFARRNATDPPAPGTAPPN
ncbi:MAG: hypothetical protein WC709_06110 [Thermoleophilia bacterium]